MIKWITNYKCKLQEIPDHAKHNARHSLNLDDSLEIMALALTPDRFVMHAKLTKNVEKKKFKTMININRSIIKDQDIFSEQIISFKFKFP